MIPGLVWSAAYLSNWRGWVGWWYLINILLPLLQHSPFLSQHRNPLNIVICSFSCPPTTTSNTHRPQKRWIRWTNSTDLWKGGAITVHPLLHPKIIAKTNCLSSFYSHMATDRGSSCPREIKLFNRVTWFIHRWGANVPWSYPCTTASDDDDDDQSMG